MRNKVAKKFRRLAETMTVGRPDKETRIQYQRLKRIHKATKGER